MPVVNEKEVKKSDDLKKLKDESQSLDDEIKKIETEYMAKLSKLLVMAQVV